MDALSPFFVAAVVFGAAGFILGRVQRELGYRREATNNLALANDRANRNGNTNSGPVALPVSDSDDDDDRNTNRSRTREAGRRAIPRDNFGPRPGRYAAGRSPRFSNEAAVMPKRLDYARDC